MGVLSVVTGIMKPGGRLRVAINESLLGHAGILARIGLAPRSPPTLYAAMRAGYNEAGLDVTAWRCEDGTRIRSSWSGRLGQGVGVRTLWVEAVKHGDGGDPGG